MPFEQVGAAHVDRHRAHVSVSGHVHDPGQLHVTLGRGGHEPRPQAVAASTTLAHEGLEQAPSLKNSVRPDGAVYQWRKVPPSELSVALVADERFGGQPTGPKPRDKGRLGRLSNPTGRNVSEA